MAIFIAAIIGFSAPILIYSTQNTNEIFLGLAIVPDTTNLTLIETTARAYALLPNDALIAATCIEHAIPQIATCNQDFPKVKNPCRIKI